MHPSFSARHQPPQVFASQHQHENADNENQPKSNTHHLERFRSHTSGRFLPVQQQDCGNQEHNALNGQALKA